MVALAQSMKLSAADVHQAGLGGLLHDIGKAKMATEIRNKPGKLSEEEFTTVKRHPQHGHDALRDGGASEHVRDICLHHHERMDGRGYPHGQAGNEISLIVVWGTKDRSHKHTSPDSLCRSAPHAEVVRFEDCGHFPDVEQPERYAALLPERVRR